jgi:hypothetical protein
LDVTATGTAGVDWANVEGQATAVNLSATNIDVDQAVASVSGAVGSVTGNVGGNVVGSVGSVLSGIPTATENADALLNRDFTAVSDTNSRTLLNAARFLRNRFAVAGVTLTVYAEDDATAAWTATIANDAAALPIVGSDPA